MKKYNMKPDIDDRMPKDLNDITTFLTKVKALKPDLLISGHEKGAATAARQMGEFKTRGAAGRRHPLRVGKGREDFPKVAKDSSARRSGTRR